MDYITGDLIIARLGMLCLGEVIGMMVKKYNLAFYVALAVMAIVLVLIVPVCKNSGGEKDAASPGEELAIEGKDYSFILDAALLETMSELKQNSLVVFSQKVKT